MGRERVIKNKKIIIIIVAFFIIITSFLLIVKVYSIAHEKEDRTNEEYMAIFIDNRVDFEYVAEIMQKYPSEYIDFSNGFAGTSEIKINDRFLCSSREIAIEILSDEEFYYHLMNLYNLDEILFIKNESSSKPSDEEIFFYFSKFPKDYHGGVFYKSKIKNNTFTHKIDENWALWMMPNV